MTYRLNDKSLYTVSDPGKNVSSPYYHTIHIISHPHILKHVKIVYKVLIFCIKKKKYPSMEHDV